MKNKIDYLLYKYMKEAINKYGLEGFEQKIKEIYSDNDLIKEAYLSTYRKYLGSKT